jgi:hypothetical protein
MDSQQFQIQISPIEKHRFPHRRRESPGCGMASYKKSQPKGCVKKSDGHPAPHLGDSRRRLRNRGIQRQSNLEFLLQNPVLLLFYRRQFQNAGSFSSFFSF